MSRLAWAPVRGLGGDAARRLGADRRRRRRDAGVRPGRHARARLVPGGRARSSPRGGRRTRSAGCSAAPGCCSRPPRSPTAGRPTRSPRRPTEASGRRGWARGCSCRRCSGRRSCCSCCSRAGGRWARAGAGPCGSRRSRSSRRRRAPRSRPGSSPTRPVDGLANPVGRRRADALEGLGWALGLASVAAGDRVARAALPPRPRRGAPAAEVVRLRGGAVRAQLRDRRR